MVNPYVKVAADQAEAAREVAPVRKGGETNPPSGEVERFFISMAIGNQRNRARVLTGIAHGMSNSEVAEAIMRLEQDTEDRLVRLRALEAPPGIIELAAKSNNEAVVILRRVQKKRSK